MFVARGPLPAALLALVVLALALASPPPSAAERESGVEEGWTPPPLPAVPAVPAGLDDTLQPLRPVVPGPDRSGVTDAARFGGVASPPASLVERLEALDPARRAGTRIHPELVGSASDGQRVVAELVAALWSAGRHDAALDRLAALESAGCVAGLGIEGDGGVRTADLRGGDVRIGEPREEAQQLCVDFDEQSGNLFTVIRWGTTTGTSAWTVDLWEADSTGWNTTYTFGSAVGLLAATGIVVGDWLYVAYVAGNAPEEARLRRFDVDTGAVDGGYGFQVAIDAGASTIAEVALAANPDDNDNRIYYLARQADGIVRLAWDAASDGTTFTEVAVPTAVPAQFSLDATFIHRRTCDPYLAVSYAAQDGSIRVLRRTETAWAESIVEPSTDGFRRTSITGYGAMLLCAYEYPFTNGTGIRYAASYDCGETWSNGSLAVPDGTIFFGEFEPEVDARGGYGAVIAYSAESGVFDPNYYQIRPGYAPGAWNPRYQYSEHDGYTGSDVTVAVIPPLELGVWTVCGMYLETTDVFRVPWLDRTVELALDAPVVTAAGSGGRLRTVHPNPVSDDATIRFALPHAGPVRLDVYDVAGRRVVRLLDGVLGAGAHAVPLGGRDLASGVYFVVLRSDGAQERRTVVVRR